MLKFLADAANIVRLRFAAVENYRYPPSVMLPAFFVLSMVNAGLFASYMGAPAAVTAALMLCITGIKWLTLAFVMQVFLHYKGAPKMNLAGFVLLTEFLNTPLILMAFIPALAFIAMVWQFWTLFVQVRGLMLFSRINPWWIALAYLLYLLAASFLGMLALSFFIANGWVNPDVMLEHMRTMQQMPQNVSP